MFTWKRLGLIVGLLVALIIAGCGSHDGKADAEGKDNVSKEMKYTITGIEPGAGQTEKNKKAIAAYDNLDGWEQEVSSTGAMLTELGDAIDHKRPIVFTAWSPHFMFAKWDLKFLDDPQGIFGDEENLSTIVRKDLKDEKTEAYKILDRMQWELSDVEDALLEAEDGEIEEVAKAWGDENQNAIAEWTKGVKSVNDMPIELVYTPWAAEIFITNVAKTALEEKGFDVTITPVDPAVMFKAIATGDADATLNASLPTSHGKLLAEYEDDLENLGANIEGAKIGLAVPAYMDVDSIEDLEPKE